MKRRWLLGLIAINLLALIALVFLYPHLMISPGPLIKPHADKIGIDCFACHAPWRGAADARCIRCHTVADIGLRTTEGVKLPAKVNKTAFHQQLTQQTCSGCHTDHLGSKRSLASTQRFSHTLLKPEVQADCRACHRPPGDTLHRQISGQCDACHSQQAWKPATFEHDKFFVLDRDHDTRCVTCHIGNDYKRYTCYGCHEHTPAKIRAEHQEEGIRDFEDCVACHRDANEDSAKQAMRRSPEGRRRHED